MRYLLIYSGIAGPSLFIIASFWLAYLTPGYKTTTQMISELGVLGLDKAWIFNFLCFFVNGFLIILLSFYVAQHTKLNHKKGIAILLGLHGLCMILATWFSCDISCTPTEPSKQQIIHNILAAIKFPALHLAVLITAFQLYKQGHHKGFAIYSLTTFIITAIFISQFILSIESRHFTGIFQRGVVFSLYLWLILFSWFVAKNMSIKVISNRSVAKPHKQ